MSDGTHIEWTDSTWNPATGCTIVSPGCTNCYAMRLAGTRLRHHPSRAGLTTDARSGPVWNGKIKLNEQWLTQPLEWKRPRTIFVCAHGDLFHEGVPDTYIDRVFAIMALAPHHTFQVLTKRAARMRAYLGDRQILLARVATAMGRIAADRDIAFMAKGHVRVREMSAGAVWPLPNVWLGVSAERQKEADERIPDLLHTPAAIRFVSAEPLLGPMHLGYLGWPGGEETQRNGYNALTGARYAGGKMIEALPKLDWVIVGGESGIGARSMHPAWARALRDQCAAADVPFFFKQWGNWAPSSPEQSMGNLRAGWQAVSGRRPAKRDEFDPEFGAAFVEHLGKKAAGRLLDGVEHNAMPLRLQKESA